MRELENKAEYIELKEEDMMMLMSHVHIHDTKQQQTWSRDSGCSNHMSGDKQWFTDFNESFRNYVRLGNNEKMLVSGKRILKFQFGGVTHVLTNVVFVPDLRNNLISIGKLRTREGNGYFNPRWSLPCISTKKWVDHRNRSGF